MSPKYPVVDPDPSFFRRLSNYRFSDYALIAGLTLFSVVPFMKIRPKEHRFIWRWYMGFFGLSGGLLSTEITTYARFTGRLENNDLVEKYGSIPIEEYLAYHNRHDQHASDLTDDGL